MLIDLKLQNYVDWHVKPVMKIRGCYGYRVILRYQDGSEKTQQKSGFQTAREAEKARKETPFSFRMCCGVEKTVTGDLNSSWALFPQFGEKAEYAVPTNSRLIGVLSLSCICR